MISKSMTKFIILYFGLLNTKAEEVEEKPGMVKMCLFYPSASGHARSDPILNQVCPSDHVHTFYGPKNIHPNTSYENLRDTKPKDSTSPWEENQSLYWHPSIYKVTEFSGQKKFTRVSNLKSSPYYRWNTNELPETVAFPPNFRMIAYSNEGADSGGETGGNLLVECCDFVGNGEEKEEDCTTTVGNPLIFPTKKCDFLGLAFAMPTCWNESKGVGSSDDPSSHVAYTTDGTVGGPCPAGYNKRIPQIQLFVRINKYKGGTYQLADGNDFFHVDFMNGWKEGSLQNIIDKCKPIGNKPTYNPPCNCEEFLTESDDVGKSAVCDQDVKDYILDEETEVVSLLPRGTCQGVDLIDKKWNVDPPFDCSGDNKPPSPSPVMSPTKPPNDKPSLSPVRNEPPDDSDDECADSDLDFKTRKKMRHCEWVTKKVKNRCRNKKIQTHCPVTCGTTKFCKQDSKVPFEIFDKDLVKNCKWVQDDPDERCKELDMCNTCRATCADFNGCSYFD